MITEIDDNQPPALDNAIDLTEKKDGGVLKVIKKAPTSDEQPRKGNKVTVHYVGKLKDGTEFDSSRDRDSKFSFNLGKGEVIKAWDIGVASMKKGEVCELHCKPDYAYGKQGSPPKIPPDSTLIFEVELFEWEGEDLTEAKDKGVVKQMLVDGQDYITPNPGATVNIKFTGKYKGTVFDERELEYILCEADDELNLPPAIDIAVKQMKREEKCNIIVQPKYGYGSNGNEKLNIPPDAELSYDIELIKFEKVKEAWEMLDEEKIEQSKIVKEKGTKYLKDNKFKQAILNYKKIIDYLSYHDAKIDGSEEDQKVIKEWKELKLAGYLNLSLACIKAGQYAQAHNNCAEALKMDPKNEKALFRDAEAYRHEIDFKHAKAAYAEVLKVNPNNGTARKFMKDCAAKIQEQAEKEKSKYKGMFDKFAKQDKEHEIRQKVEQKEKAKAAKKVNEKGDVNGDQPMEAEST
uniref:peptidylprolyl isomerase n=1 Tax=Phallusia mammillata TaxID=59560 RepID=A0A6F9DCD0_9ASCI|nr:peptidyl-prolyl cis-trans isomerase FKBP4-like [Phallusia mammillata]